MKIKILGVNEIEPVSFVVFCLACWCVISLITAVLILATLVELAILVFNLPARLFGSRSTP